jgi:hypothetical protein
MKINQKVRPEKGCRKPDNVRVHNDKLAKAGEYRIVRPIILEIFGYYFLLFKEYYI